MLIPYNEDSWRTHGETLGALLERRTEIQGDTPYIHLLADAGGEETISFRAMYDGARRAAAALQARGVGPGDRVLMVLPTGREFLNTLFGAFLIGAAAVPAYPPLRAKGLNEYQDRLARLIAAAEPALIVSFPRVRLVVEAAAFQAGSPARVVDGAALLTDAAGFEPVAVSSEDTALVQFSSGSTGDPRGIMLTHRALLANVASVLAVVQPGPEDINCSWLPLYHDMGLIGGLFMPLFCGCPLVLLSPQSFLLDPKRWLWAIHRYRATVSTAPNFAYQLVASRLADEELEGLDLSSWRVALNGAEPVSPASLEGFAERLAPYGFDARALAPVYGLAEAALGAVFPDLGVGARFDAVDALALREHGQATASGAPDAAVFASVGRPLPGFEVRVVDEGRVLGERAVGEIQLRGPSLMSGVLNDPAATAAAFDGSWLRTGDLGYLADGQLYIVGRLKDLILKGGRNYAPQDLERAAETVAGVRKGCVAAFGVPDATTGTERVLVVAETREDPARHTELARLVTARVAEAVGLAPDAVVLVPPGAVPKTSSGKLQRGRCREHYLADTLRAPQSPTLLAQTRLIGQAVVQRTIAAARLPRKAAPHGS